MLSRAALQRTSLRLWRSLLHGKRVPVALGLLVTLLVYSLFESSSPVVQALRERLDNVVYDLRFNMFTPSLRSSDPAIVIVDYDQKSLQREGQWPWSRFKIGQLVERLGSHGALVVGFDVFFPEPERNLVSELQSRLELEPGAQTAGQELLPQIERYRDVFDGDKAFAAAMAHIDTVLGFSFSNDATDRSGVLPQPVFSIADEERARISLRSVQGHIGNVAELQAAARGGGFFDTWPDIDGNIRSYPLVMQFEDKVYPSLALEMARLYLFADEFGADIEADATGRRIELQGIRVGDVRIPTDANANVKVPYIGPSGSYPYLSATDVLRGTLTEQEEALLFNSLVLVGTTATGLYDLRATPVQEVYPGVEIHANILNGLLNSSRTLLVEDATGNGGDSAARDESATDSIVSVLNQGRINPFPLRPDWERGVIRFGIVLIGVTLALIYPHLGPTLLGMSSVTFLIGLTAFNFHLWSRYNLDFSLVILLLLIVLISAVNMTYGFLKEGVSRRAIKGMFDQYVPPAHIDAMLDDPEKYNFEGESKELTVLFSDIRGFTTISEQLSAVQLKAMLNDFFTPITGIIFEEQGTIDKYVGDMVMAFWGAPLDDPEHRRHAVGAALKMLDKVEELKPSFKARGLPEVNVGIGINTGMMSVGDMGSTYRRSYTVLGDAVNLGSRLEGITKVYGVRLLIGEQTYDGLAGFLCRQIDKVQVKGKEEPIRIYQPLCREEDAAPELHALVAAWHEAYDLYQHQQWSAAERCLLDLQVRDPATILYTLYLERIATLRNLTLPADWDGTYRHTSK